MDLVTYLLDIVMHIDNHLANIIGEYGTLTYVILFLVIFVETGFVVMPFLPGDSLLFAAGAFVALDMLNLPMVLGLLSLAAILGDTVNYWIGRSLGRRAYAMTWVNHQHLDRAQKFYDTYGGKTIVIARFVPIVRTFAPFVAGIGRMSYAYFIVYNIVGGMLWVSVCSLAGDFIGNMSIVKQNFELVILGIVFISILPIIIELYKAKKTSVVE
jgi:membrane-associated protein